MYRMVHDTAIAWLANERARLDANITRAAGFMAFALVAVGAGIGISTAAAPDTAFGVRTWSGLAMVAIGAALCLLATVVLMWPLDAPELDPKKLIEEYESRQSDEIYRSLAVAGHPRMPRDH